MAHTTHGEISDELLEFKYSVTHDDEQVKVVRRDKYFNGEWVGNDIDCQIKTGFEFKVTQARLG